MATALITGASRGIGKELAKIHASHGGDLILIARNEGDLLTLKNELLARWPIRVEVIVADLSSTQAVNEAYQSVKQLNMSVDYLINNAGFGGYGPFYQRQFEQDREMVMVNILALTQLTHCFLPEMIVKGSGKILNVSSTASFLPGPLQATYYATKAYVTSLSEAIAQEVAGSGVTVTALCPGPVDTDFVKRGGLQGVKAWGMAKSAPHTASVGYQAMLNGKRIAFDNKGLGALLTWIVPLLPRRWVSYFSQKTMERRL
ncbi:MULTISPECIES: SDR family oxidoreductase [unclassified Vibrio]|uniref:SDR family NAD(P)-dependent oxidoreductase n=1 Tax=Vibrio sp. HB236076 TaxID=3232307 RepID=A0AB39HGW7_9VIBR|nr:SDR family oxidoreductase [Vibrio sp. HB161653]MDP5252689.1 SDR family oxidoreductase [Vibrio sp. HB161653]